jgi:hypothetical protein
MSDLRLLAVVPDSNAAVKFRHLARYNPSTRWDCITIRDEATTQLYDWADTVHHLCLRDRWFTDVPFAGCLPNIPELAYERAVAQLDLPLVTNFMHFPEALLDPCEVLNTMLTRWTARHYDALILWGERCWYNEVTKAWAQMWSKDAPLPTVFMERTVFPGMFTVDGTGLSAGHNDLPLYRDVRMETDEFAAWVSGMTLTGVEQQRPTTAAEVRQLLPPGKTIFVPLQMPFDTNMVFRAEGGVNTNEALLDWVARHRPGMRVVVKKHPGDWFTDAGRLAAKCEELGFLLVDFAIHPLLEQVQEVVTINSQVGIEAWMHGVPVKWLGEPGFKLEGVTGAEMLQVLRKGYYVVPGEFGGRVREIIKRGPVTEV